MNDKFDELSRNMAQSLTRRSTQKKFGAGLAGIVLVGDYIWHMRFNVSTAIRR